MLIKLLFAIPLVILAWVAWQYMPVSGKTYDHVVFVPGVRTNPDYLVAWKQYLNWHLSDSQHHFLEGYYDFDDQDDLEKKQSELQSMLSSIPPDQNIVVITHSYGGILLGSVLNDQSYQNIKSIVTMASPLAADSEFSDRVFVASRQKLGYDDYASSYQHTPFCGYIDSVVPCKLASINQAPVRLLSGHSTFLIPQLIHGRRIINAL